MSGPIASREGVKRPAPPQPSPALKGLGGALEHTDAAATGLAHPQGSPGIRRDAIGPALAPPVVHDVLRTAGAPLDTATRGFFEPRFGHDFSKVRVHHDRAAAASARAVDASAYTVGSKIVFGDGRYEPQTPRGRSLLAHELTHAVQQQDLRGDPGRAIPIGPPRTAYELEADRWASRTATRVPEAGARGPACPAGAAPAPVSRLNGVAALLQRTGLGCDPGPLTTDPDTFASPGLTPGVAYVRPTGSPVAAPDGPRARRGPTPSPTPAAPQAAPPSKAPAPAAQQTPAPQPVATPAGAAGASAPAATPVAEGPKKEPPSPPAGGAAGAGEKVGADAADTAKDSGVAAKAGVPGAEPAKEAAAAKAPASPKDDPDFQAVAGRVHAAGAKLKAHAPAPAKAKEAQAAAVSPPAELQGRAAAVQAASIDKEQPRPFDRAAFIKALMDKIASIAPKTLGEADEFKKSGKVASIKGDLSGRVESTKAQAQGDIPAKVQQPPDPSSISPKPVTPLSAPDAGPQPPDVGAAAAVPKPRSDSEVSLQEGSAALDHQMSGAKVTEEQLAKSNEPTFQQAVDAKTAAQDDAAKAPQAFRQGEKQSLGQAQAEAKGSAQKDLQSIHGGRAQALEKVGGQQADTKAQDEKARAEIAAEIQKRYDDAKARTEARLKKLDADVDAAFEKGATEAQKAFDDQVADQIFRYKLERYTGPAGPLLWAKDALLGLPDEVNAFYEQARQGYIRRMTDLLDSIAGIVETGLTESKAIVSQGRKSIDDYLNGLPAALQAVGHEAAQGIQAKFDELEHSVDDKQGELIDSLAQKYTEKLQQIDDKIAEMKKSNGGLVDAAKEAIGGVIDTIIKLKDMLVNVLAKASTAINLIIADPIGFLGNLVAAVKQGFMGFVGKIGLYLEQGLLGWLFGALEGAGIELPKTFDLKGILGLILQVLGLTYANIRSRAVKILGEKVVSALETAAEIFRVLIAEGPAGLWNWIKDRVIALRDVVLGSIKDFVITKVITAGATWIISLLNPASAFIKACKAIYDVVMFFVERGQQILSLVNAILDSIISIAKGNIGGAAAYIESVLAKAIPIMISFLASLLGLGGISEKIRAIIEKIREPINAAIDWVINKAVAMVKAAGRVIAGLFGGKEKPSEKPDDRELDPAAAAAVKEQALDDAQTNLQGHRLSKVEEVDTVLKSVFDRHKGNGLKSLSIGVVDEQTAEVGILAAASEPEKRVIKWEEIFAKANPEDKEKFQRQPRNETNAAVSVNGRLIGAVVKSDKDNHAEENLLDSHWKDALDAARTIAKGGGDVQVVVVINRAPCSTKCTGRLVEAIREAKQDPLLSKARFILAPTGVYEPTTNLTAEDQKVADDRYREGAEKWGTPFYEVVSKAVYTDATTSMQDLQRLVQAGWDLQQLLAREKPTSAGNVLGEAAHKLAVKAGRIKETV